MNTGLFVSSSFTLIVKDRLLNGFEAAHVRASFSSLEHYEFISDNPYYRATLRIALERHSKPME